MSPWHHATEVIESASHVSSKTMVSCCCAQGHRFVIRLRWPHFDVRGMQKHLCTATQKFNNIAEVSTAWCVTGLVAVKRAKSATVCASVQRRFPVRVPPAALFAWVILSTTKPLTCCAVATHVIYYHFWKAIYCFASMLNNSRWPVLFQNPPRWHLAYALRRWLINQSESFMWPQR